MLVVLLSVRAGEMDQEVALIGGRATEGVVRIGDTVRRPIKARAPFVHELLRHWRYVDSVAFRGSSE